MTAFDKFGYRTELDMEATRAWYDSAEDWGCDCWNCLNFVAAAKRREMPEELLNVLDELGIPPEKATYVCTLIEREEDGTVLYHISYRLAGRIVSAPEKRDGEIWFEEERFGTPPWPEDFPKPFFEMEICPYLPWVLREPLIMLSSELEEDTDETEALLRRTITTALWCEGVDVKCEVNVLLTDDEGIREINREQREVDAATDVLSFPMFDYRPGEKPTADDADPDTDAVPLGDMVISVERAKRQAEEYGHSFRRELAYLAVHSVLHLLGYDHLDEGEQKKQMREHEERIMDALGIGR